MNDLTDEERQYAKYIQAGVAMLEDAGDQKPSARALVERCGGSMTTAHKAMQVFWRYVGRQLSEGEKYPEIPDEAVVFMKRLMKLAHEQSRQALADEWRRVQAHEEQVSAQIEEKDDELRALRADSEELKEELSGIRAKHEDVLEELAEVKRDLERERQAHKDSQEEGRRLSTEVEALTSRLKELKSERDKQDTRLAEVTEKVLQLQSDNSRLEERLEQLARRERDALQDVQAWQDRHQATEKRLEAEQKALSTAKAENAGLQQAVTDKTETANQLEGEIKSLAAELSEQRRQAEMLKVEVSRAEFEKEKVSELSQRCKVLEQERDRLWKMLEKGKKPKNEEKK